MYIYVYIFGMEMGQKKHFSYQISQEKKSIVLWKWQSNQFFGKTILWQATKKKKKQKQKNLKMIKLLETYVQTSHFFDLVLIFDNFDQKISGHLLV